MFAAIALLAAQAFQLDVAAPHVKVTPNKAYVKKQCEKSELGCTLFMGARLKCDCYRTSAWHIRATAMFVPFVFAANELFLRHEQEHIADLTQRVEGYGGLLTSTGFATESECRQAARAEEAVFEPRMRHFAQVSVEELR